MEKLKRNITATAIDVDGGEKQRRSELSRYAPQLFTMHVYVNGRDRSTLEDIEKRSKVLLEKGVAARFIEKEGDSKEVARLIERLREAIALYQVSESWIVSPGATYTGGQLSQQQAIYDQVTDLTVRIFRFISIVYTDDQPFRLVVFRCTLEISRDGIQKVCGCVR